MNKMKCPECGLINWAEDEHCKRCKRPFKKLNGQPNIKRDMKPLDPPSMFTFQGIGSRLIGWHHQDDGTASATVWFTFLFLPIFPISRFRLVSPGSGDFERKISFNAMLMAFSPIKFLTTEYQFIEELSLSGEETLKTYLYAYLWVPIKLFIPLYILIQLSPRSAGPDDGSTTPMLISGSIMIAWMGFALFSLTRLLHKSRGGR